MYMFDGTKWAAVSNMTVLNHSDYQAMGQTYDNLSGDAPKQYLPTYLKQTYPYAQADDVRYVVYNYYNGSANVTRCAECRFNGTEWTGGFNGSTVMTAQFVKKNNKWEYSPDVVITLPAGRGIEISTLYYQTCVDWGSPERARRIGLRFQLRQQQNTTAAPRHIRATSTCVHRQRRHNMPDTPA